MISIIICSRRETIDRLLEENIAASIGVPFEIIWLNVTSPEPGIFSAYNAGAAKSRFDHLCFMHDDILFKSEGWGRVVVDLLADRQIGVVGIAGAVLKTKAPSPWWVSNVDDCSEYLRLRLIQTRGIERRSAYEELNPEKAAYAKVVVLDGVWLCCRKELWEQIRFDDTRFSGFHFYDMDFSIGAWDKGYTNIVTYQVLLDHRSSGQLDSKWLSLSAAFQQKWKKKLPASVSPLSRKQQKELEYRAIKNHLLVSVGNNYGRLGYYLGYWIKLLGLKTISKEHLSLLKAGIKNSIKRRQF